MAAGVGYSKTISNGIIFAYDISDIKNSYIGEPTTNLLSSYFNTNYVLAGGEFSQYADLAPIFNTYGYGSSYSYSLSMDVKVNLPNSWVLVYMQNGSYTKYSFVYNSIYPTSEYQRFKFEGLNANLSTPSETAAILAFYTGYGSGVNPTVKNVQVELKSHSTPYINGTRSSSQGLLDLSNRGNTINLVNMSYDSNAQPYFDGTDDYTDVTSNLGTLSEYTIEHVSYKGSEDRMPIAFRGGPVFYQYGDNSWYYTHGGVAGEYYYPKSFSINGWGHWTIVYNGSYVRIYRNGRYEGQQATSGTANWTNGMRIGYWPYGGGYAWNGKIAVVRMYNRALSDSEVSQNYNHYKTRFNLS